MFVEDFSTPETEVGVEDEVVKTLRRAAELIRERGWCQGVQEDDKRRLCVMGALHTAVHGSHFKIGYPLVSAARAQLEQFVQINSRDDAVDWNNHVERTKAQVIAALEGAASCRLAALQGKG